jgi:hypothetical protein
MRFRLPGLCDHNHRQLRPIFPDFIKQLETILFPPGLLRHGAYNLAGKDKITTAPADKVNCLLFVAYEMSADSFSGQNLQQKSGQPGIAVSYQYVRKIFLSAHAYLI